MEVSQEILDSIFGKDDEDDDDQLDEDADGEADAVEQEAVMESEKSD